MTREVYSPDVPARYEIPLMTADKLKDTLVGLHNQLVVGSSLTDYDADKNVMGSGLAGAMDGCAIRYPRAIDKAELLSYAVEQAKLCEDPRDGALLLASSVVAVHPFVDGNGRISRALYCDYMGVERLDEDRANNKFDVGEASREVIDLGTAFTQDPWLSRWSEHYPYVHENVPHSRLRIGIYREGIQNELEAITLDANCLEGLSAEEQADLISAIGADRYGNAYGNDGAGLRFAVAAVLKQYPELDYLHVERDGGEWSLVDLHEAMATLSHEQKQYLVASLWHHRKLRALASIDFLTDETGRDTIKSHVPISARDLVIERTNNLHSSTVWNKQ